MPRAIAFEQVTVTGVTSIGSVLTAPPSDLQVTIVVEQNAVRWRADGTNPTASVGMPLAVGDVLVYDDEISKIKFIPQAGSALLSIHYDEEHA